MHRRLPELAEIEALGANLPDFGQFVTEVTLEYRERYFPVYSFRFSNNCNKSLPAILFVGGIHGLERIGTRVAVAYLRTLISLLSWDKVTRGILEHCQIHFLPLTNPGGMFFLQRSNPSGVDLMRNAPVEAEGRTLFLAGGHRISRHLPWYRGKHGAEMEAEAQVLCDYVRNHIFPAPFSMAVDLHSGFGAVDRLWFPYAKTPRPFPHIAEAMALKYKLDETMPNHVYSFEPQSRQYLTHGDLWDYLYDEALASNRIFLPLCLEMGSWLWVRKNPRQILSLLGVFNPVIPHRLRRILRRHLGLLDFLVRATASYESWALLSKDERNRLENEALSFWFSGGKSR